MDRFLQSGKTRSLEVLPNLFHFPMIKVLYLATFLLYAQSDFIPTNPVPR